MGMCLGFVFGASLTSTVLGGVIGGVVAAGVLYVISWLAHWVRYRNPIKVWHEPRREDRVERIDLDDRQREHQPIQITLTVHQRVHMEYVRVSIRGDGNTPEVRKLYDWNTGEGVDREHPPLPRNVSTRSNERGTWYWEYGTPLLRTKGNTIALGVMVETRGIFSGEIEFQPSFVERTKVSRTLTLPIHVRTS